MAQNYWEPHPCRVFAFVARVGNHKPRSATFLLSGSFWGIPSAETEWLLKPVRSLHRGVALLRQNAPGLFRRGPLFQTSHPTPRLLLHQRHPEPEAGPLPQPAHHLDPPAVRG